MAAAPALLTLLLIAARGVAPAAAAPAQTIIPCDPPLDRPLRLSMTQHLWRTDGSAASLTVDRILRFSRDRDGFLVSAHIATLDTDQPEPRAHDRMYLAYGTPGDVSVVIRLDAAMGIVGIESLDDRWADFRRRQSALADSMATEGAGQRAAAVGRMLDAMGPAERVGLLSAFLAPVLHHCGVLAPDGAVHEPNDTIRLERLSDSPQLRDVGHYVVDARTGLLRSLDRRLTTVTAPLRPLHEEWTLDPAN